VRACIWVIRDSKRYSSISSSAGEHRKPHESAVQDGHLEQIALSSQQQLGSMDGVCDALLAQVARISLQLSRKEQEVSELQGILRLLP